MRRTAILAGGLLGATLLLVGACGLGVLIGASAQAAGGLPFQPGTVALITVEGPITSGATDLTGGASSRRIAAYLERAKKDPTVKAIVLRVDSPGGGVTASDEIRNAVLKARARGKVVVVSMGSIAASGGYYLAAPADRIVANPTSLTGSIGVITVIPNLVGLLEKLGVAPETFKSGPFKDSSSGLRPLNAEDRRLWQALVDELYERFVTVVAEGRGLDPATVRALADGRVFSGRQALALKLVDELGDLPEAIALAGRLSGLGDDPAVVRYQERGLLETLLASWLRPPWQQVLTELGLVDEPLQYRFLP
jgi:protease-4